MTKSALISCRGNPKLMMQLFFCVKTPAYPRKPSEKAGLCR